MTSPKIVCVGGKGNRKAFVLARTRYITYFISHNHVRQSEMSVEDYTETKQPMALKARDSVHDISLWVFVCLICIRMNYCLLLLQYPYPTTPEHASQHKAVSGVEVEFPSTLSLSAVSILQGVCRFVLNVCFKGSVKVF